MDTTIPTFFSPITGGGGGVNRGRTKFTISVVFFFGGLGEAFKKKRKKSVTFFTLGGEGGGVKIGLCYTIYFFSKTWSKMA